MAGSIALIRSPMPSQVERVIASADISFNTELSVLRLLSQAAVQANRSHGVILMVELGDLREGIMPTDLPSVVHAVMELPGLTLQGIGTNLACHSGTSPDASNMAQLSALTCTIESTFGRRLATISGGNSANLNWAFSGQDCGRVNDLRLGESILLGCETLHRCPLDGLYTDAITLVAEVIELKQKPSKPWGALAQTALGTKAKVADRGTRLAQHPRDRLPRLRPARPRAATRRRDPRRQQRPPHCGVRPSPPDCRHRSPLSAPIQRPPPGHDLAICGQGLSS